jgi:hypothetical protein
MAAEDGKTYYDCFLCEQSFQFGPHVYDGRHVRLWGIQLCNVCLMSNWDGVVLEGHPRLKQHLMSKGIPIKFNAKGWLPIPA